jgi:hypothetical protein
MGTFFWFSTDYKIRTKAEEICIESMAGSMHPK